MGEIQTETPQLPAREAAEAAEYARASLAPATLRAYRADWEDFGFWCRQRGLPSLPAAAETVGAYLASLGPTHSRSTLRRRLAAIGQAHRLARQPWTPGDPAIRNTLHGILRRHGRPARQAAALTTAEVKRLVAVCGTDPAGLRDRALLLLGFAAALRRAELVAIVREDLVFTTEGLELLIRRSKTDTVGAGHRLGIPRGEKPDTCPVRAMDAWLRVSHCEYGPVFRRVDPGGGFATSALHPDAVRQILRKRAAAAMLTLPAGDRLSPHGLRAGFVTTAYKAGVPDEAIMAHTRHKDLRTMRGYVRRAVLVSESPARKLGL